MITSVGFLFHFLAFFLFTSNKYLHLKPFYKIG
jgi:hypothetical protein